MKDIVVLGGGLSGLCIAYREVKLGNKVTIIEKEPTLGGLARSVKIDGFSFDIGPHILRSSEDTIIRFATALATCKSTFSNPMIWKKGVYHDPVTPNISLRNLKLLGISKEKIKKEIKEIINLRNDDEESYESVIKKRIGSTLYEEYFSSYTKKWWGTEPKTLSVDLAPKNIKIGGTAFYGHLTTNYRKMKQEIYPSKGIGAFCDSLVKILSKYKVNIYSSTSPIKFIIDGDSVSKVIVRNNESKIEEELNCDKIYSTIPITHLSSLLKIKAGLKYRCDICIFLAVPHTKKPLMKYKWIYFHDKEIIFGRLSENRLYSIYNVPPGYTGLCAEVTCFENDVIWKSKMLPYKVYEQLSDMKFVNKTAEVLGVSKEPFAYPLYLKGYDKEVEKIRSKLPKGIVIAGRTGMFKILNMDGCFSYAI